MRAVLVQPEHCRRVAQACAGNRQLDPILDRRIFRLAHTEDVALLHVLFQQGLAGASTARTLPLAGASKVLLCEPYSSACCAIRPDVGHAAHGLRIEGTVFLAVIDDHLVDPRIATVRDHGLGIVQLAVRSPHLAGLANHRRHGSIDDHIAGHMQIGDALVRVNHRQLRPRLVAGFDVGLDLGTLGFRQGSDLREQIAETVVDVDAQLLDGRSVLLENIFEENGNRVTKHDGIGYLHHGGLEVQRQHDALLASHPASAPHRSRAGHADS